MTSLLTTRRKFLQWGAAAAAGAGAVLAADATIVEPDFPQLTKVEVPLRRLPPGFDGYTIAQLSDFHYDPHFSVHAIKNAVGMVNSLSADLVVLTGDFVTMPVLGQEHQRWRQALEGAEPCARLLQGIKAKDGLVAVMGNHDQFSDPDSVTGALQQAGIRVLRNQSFAIERSGGRLWMSGVNDVLGGEADMKVALRGIPRHEATVLLCHEPDFADHVAAFPVDLQLSGHSHGGQIRIPFLGAPYLPPLGRKYPWGLRQIGPLTLYTNVGLGTIRLPMRWNCPPEVTQITLRSLR